MEIKQKNKKGISLIVLVITIIVMIILAAAIILSLNSSGIIGKANKAKEDRDNANLLEAATIAAAEWDLEYKLGETKDDAKTYITKKLEAQNFTAEQIAKLGITESGEVCILTYTMYSDGTNEAPIPEGFSVSSVSTERTIENGLVIIDEAGNEFVWVPVDDITKFARTTTYDGETITNPDTDNSTTMNVYVEPYETYAEEYGAMYNSVKEYKGFYIGRYETGTNVERLEEKTNKTTEIFIKKDKQVYNCVAWGGPWPTDIVGDVTCLVTGNNQGKGAVQLSQEMYGDSESVVSTLCYGVQWDAAMQFISTRGIKDTTYATNSTDKGNYTGSLVKTGYYARNNIYDMAGNVEEWTMEADERAMSHTLRGGYYRINGGRPNEEFNASYRMLYPNDLAGNIFGFRVALYIK